MSESEDRAEAAVKRIESAKARARANPRSRNLAIRAFCLECVGGSLKDVRECVCHDCSLYHLRPGGKTGE